MIFFDSHCHLDDIIFNPDFKDVLGRAFDSKVLRMIVVGVDEATSHRAVYLAKKHSEVLYATVGFHPHNVAKCSHEALDRLIKAAKHSKVVAWGEIGLDFNRMYSERNQQEFWFTMQLRIADDLKMPIILHERDTEGRLIEILEDNTNPLRVAVVHCFSGNRYEMERYLEMGFYIGVTGMISVLGRGKLLRDLVKYIPSNKLLVETDAPYLTPAPKRNKIKRNEPAFIDDVLLKLAEARQENESILAKQIWENTCRFFRLDVSV